jgi:choline dehydrogenase-like flavoprotein
VPGFFQKSAANCYDLHYHGEQVPNPESRVTLSDQRDALGMPRLNINLQFTPQDVDGVLRTHEMLDQHLRRHQVGQLEYLPDDRAASIWDQATDGYHQIGTTRMSDSAADGVVDPNCRVHGVDNLYVASSSTFPTSGQANSTFLIVALALRLADHLAAECDLPACPDIARQEVVT